MESLSKTKDGSNLALLNIGYAVHRGDWNYKHVNSPFARIYLVKEGRAKLNLPMRTQELAPGHLYIIPPFTLHSYECDDYFSLYYIHIYGNHFFYQHILEDFLFPTEIFSSQLLDMLVEHLYHINPGRELSHYDPLEYDNQNTLIKTLSLHSHNRLSTIIETEGILMQLLSHFLKEASPKYNTEEDRVKKVLRDIRMNIDQPISVESLASSSSLSKDYFSRLFKQEMTITPYQYIYQKKIERAQLLLITTDLSIKDIAYSLAFNDVSYFSKLFKITTGHTPKEYRVLHNQ